MSGPVPVENMPEIALVRHNGEMVSRVKFGPKRQAKFLEILEKTGNISAASDSVGISRNRAWQLKAKDPIFAAACEQCLEKATDRLEESVRKRAEVGTKKGVWYKGKRVGVERETHDTLAMFMLKARRAEYRDSPPSVQVGLSVSTAVKLSDDQLLRIAARAIPAELLDKVK